MSNLNKILIGASLLLVVVLAGLLTFLFVARQNKTTQSPQVTPPVDTGIDTGEENRNPVVSEENEISIEPVIVNTKPLNQIENTPKNVVIEIKKGVVTGQVVIAVRRGSPVIWKNNDQETYTITFKDQTIPQVQIQPNSATEVTFQKPGSFPFKSTQHPQIHGILEVSL